MPTTFANSIDSNPIYAARAEQDKDGNRIDTTYAKLADIPTVPVTDVEVNGTSVVSGGVAAVTVPTATSDLQNDSGFITLSDVPAQVNADWNSSAGASEILNKPTIPSGTQLVPAATSADADKVLTVNAQGVPGWAAGGGGSTYTAGDGISIDENDEISAKLGDGLEIGTSLSPVTDTARAIGYSDDTVGVTVMQQLRAELVAAIETTGLTYTVQNLTDNNNVSQPWVYGGATSLKLYPAIFATASYGSGPTTDTSMRLVLSTTGIDVASSSGIITAGTQFTYNLDDVNTSLSTITWETISDQPENYSLGVTWQASWGGWSCLVADGSYTKDAMYESGTLSYQTATLGAIAVSNPLPAVTSSDDDKVLKASYSGGVGSYSWESEPAILGLTAGSNVTITEANNAVTIAATDTTYTSGNMISIDANNSNAIGVSTTAGITDIQQVAALPANPVSTVLYLIPET